MPRTGMTSIFSWRGHIVNALAEKAGEEGVRDAAEMLLEESNKIIPLEEGDLAATGRVESEGPDAIVTYDSPYAVVQHENQSYHHSEGRKAKYLENTVDENHGPVKEKIAGPLKGALGVGALGAARRLL